jgi:nucleoid-associated protein YejK
MTRFRKSLRKFPLLSEFEWHLNADLFAKVKAIYEQKKKAWISIQKSNTFKKIQKFLKKRCQFAWKQKKILREIDKELSKTSLSGENVLVKTQGFQLHIINERPVRFTGRNHRLGP